MDDKFLSFLHQVKVISDKYKEMAKLTGENFNIFNILKLTTSEVRTHSAFIAELLDPKGCHDMGSIFLELFIDSLKQKTNSNNSILNPFNSKESEVEIEKHISQISIDEEEGGRIDILITDKQYALIIENKIYAEDQKNQLLRYHNFGIKEFQNKKKDEVEDRFILLYLTLNGTPPSKESLGNSNKVKYLCISYKENILNWLLKCREKAVKHAQLRETITQYIYLIKYLTNQLSNIKMEEDIKKLLEENLDLIKPLTEAHSAYLKMSKDWINNLINSLNKEKDKPIHTEDSFKVITEFVNDGDGFQLCFWGKVNEEIIHGAEIEKLRKLREKLPRKFNVKDKPICWIPIEKFKGENLNKISVDDFINALNREKELIKEISDEAKEYVTEFKYSIESLIK